MMGALRMALCSTAVLLLPAATAQHCSAPLLTHCCIRCCRGHHCLTVTGTRDDGRRHRAARAAPHAHHAGAIR
eukprot:6836113-Prymnesium_polylepis.1